MYISVHVLLYFSFLKKENFATRGLQISGAPASSLSDVEVVRCYVTLVT